MVDRITLLERLGYGIYTLVGRVLQLVVYIHLDGLVAHETMLALPNHAQALLYRLLECAAYGHHLADYQLDVICEEEKRETLESIIFTETTTIGIRRCQMERTVMKREFATITTEYGDAAVKICRHGEIEKVYPEYESAALIAEKSGMPVGEAGAWIVQKYKEGK